uniref:Uncharacterized protein n=1 Tax=viral metagenome TaxID=1070528 RepID=A0A6C0B843_9ZZZZ
MDELEDIQYNYENGFSGDKYPRKAPIETVLTNELKKLYEINLKNRLTQWRYFKEDFEDIDNLIKANLNKIQYLNVMENHIYGVINECRSKLLTELKDVEVCVNKKEKERKRIEKGDMQEKRVEDCVLKRLNTMPEDMVRVIGEFLFSPNMKNILITSKYLPDLYQFKKVRLPKLKIMARHISLKIQAIGEKIIKNRNIMNSIPAGHEDKNNIYVVANCRRKIRETLKRSLKIEEISRFIAMCEKAIQTIEKLGYPITTRNCYSILNKIYHLMIIASKPQNNYRN